MSSSFPQPERHDDTRLPGAGGPTGAVEVRLVIFRGVVVDDEVDPVDVETSGRDVGRDERVNLACREVTHRPLAHPLVEVSVDRPRSDAR